VYSKKEILIAVVISCVILVLCVGTIITAIMVASAPPTPTPTEGSHVPIPAQTDDILSTFASTGEGQNVPAGEMSAEVQYVLDSSAIPCLVILLIVVGIIIGSEIRNRRKERGG
jgi:hypothetical protein